MSFAVTSLSGSGTTLSIYSNFNQVTSVASGVLTTILSYTVPVGLTSYMGFIEATGTNIAQFQVSINSTVNAIQRTYFGGELNTSFNYNFGSQNGYVLNAGDTVLVQVIHTRPNVGDFEARLIYAQ